MASDAKTECSVGDIAAPARILPASGLLSRFNDVVGDLFRTWIGSVHQSRTLAALRDALLPKLLSGELSTTRARRVLEEVDW